VGQLSPREWVLLPTFGLPTSYCLPHLQRIGTLTTIVSFTRAMSEENESLPTSFIGWTSVFKGFTVTRSLACGSRGTWKETTQSGWPSSSGRPTLTCPSLSFLSLRAFAVGDRQ